MCVSLTPDLIHNTNINNNNNKIKNEFNKYLEIDIRIR